MQTAFEPLFTWMRKGYFNFCPRRGFILIGFMLSLSNSVHRGTVSPQRVKRVAPPARSAQLCGSSCKVQTPFCHCVDCYLFHIAFPLSEICFIVTFSRNTWHNNRFFSLSWQTAYFWKVNVLFLIPNKPLLKLTLQGAVHQTRSGG